MPRGDQTPTRQHGRELWQLRERKEGGKDVDLLVTPAVYRNKETIQLLDNFVVNNTTEQFSQDVECGPYRHFGLFVFIDSTGTPTTLQIKVQFLDRWTGRWYTFKQGPFAALFWEDGDTASGIAECFQDKCLGRAIRVSLTGVGTTSIAYFTVSISAEFWN